MDGLDRLKKQPAKSSQDDIHAAIGKALEGSYVIAVQRIDHEGRLTQSIFRNWPANRLQESTEEFERAQINEARRVDIRETVRAYLVELGLIEE